jgi:hypothetical protein
MMSTAARRNLDADSTVKLDAEPTIRLVPMSDMPLDESPTVERRVSARAPELQAPELDNALRLLTPPAPPVYTRTASNVLPQPHLAREVGLALWHRTGAGFARDAVLFARDAVLLFARDATFVLRPVIERFVAASWRGAFSVLRGLSQLSRIAAGDWSEGPRRRQARSTVFQARMTDAEIAILHAIADSWGVSASEVVRTLVLRECQKADFGVGRPRVTRLVARDRNRLNRVA